MLAYKDIIAILATLIAAFAGAWGAFLLENERKKREVADANIGAANRAIYTIFNLWNVLEQYRKEVLEPYRSKSDAWLSVAANPTIPTGIHTFQADELQFLLSQSKPEIYAALLLEEQRFAIAIDLIRTRSSLVLDQVFAKMASAQIPIGANMLEVDVEQILGIDTTHKLKQLTAAIYRNVDENLESLQKQYETLRSSMQELYPKRKLIQIQFDSPRAEKNT
ncbi:hypothetical protein [Chromobacterium violaceum]|uniref:hypothetical protein n=1 Tax=Chromobacterium violaceum TaxID=536 RepID=UPI00143D789C|nr:hypothetical protein [Chromobacterium violaceum]QIY81267.1 hypothetical protein FOB43_19740 [Chromobacterium violaceum]